MPAGVDGRSVLPVLLGEDRPREDRFMYWGGTPGNAEAVRWGRWKAVRESPEEPLEIFDLTNDIGEQNDVAGDNPEVLNAILEFMEQAVSDLPAQ